MSDDYHRKSLAERKLNVFIEPDTKIRITEDHEATGEVATAYDYWRAGSGRQKVPGIIKCFGARPDFLRQVVDFSNKVLYVGIDVHKTRCQLRLIPQPVSVLTGQPCLLPACSGSPRSMRSSYLGRQAGGSWLISSRTGIARLCRSNHKCGISFHP